MAPIPITEYVITAAKLHILCDTKNIRPIRLTYALFRYPFLDTEGAEDTEAQKAHLNLAVLVCWIVSPNAG